MTANETDGLAQFHWQDPKNPSKTEMVAQGKFDRADDLEKWVRRMAKNHADKCPDGWVPMVCTWDSEYFVKAKPDN